MAAATNTAVAATNGGAGVLAIDQAIGVLQAVLASVTAIGILALLVRTRAVIGALCALVNIGAIDPAATITAVASATEAARDIGTSGVAVAVIGP